MRSTDPIGYTTKKPHAAACEAVRRACRERRFSVLVELDLAAALRARRVPVPGEWTVFEVCDARHARELLRADVLAKALLPCRVAVHTTPAGATRIAALRPTATVDPGLEPELAARAAALEEELEEVVARAGRPEPLPDDAAP
jgi:uncharacterized protein (DUF302 family)